MSGSSGALEGDGLAAAYCDDLASDVVGIANQKANAMGNVLGLAEALQRQLCDGLGLGRVAGLWLRPKNRARGDGIDPYIGRQISCQGLGHHDQSGLGHTIDTVIFKRSIRAVVLKNGGTLARPPVSVKRVIQPIPTHLVSFAMQEVAKNGTARGLRKQLPDNLTVAGKTGTTDAYRDSWFAGFSEEYLAVVWVGRDDNRPAGLTGAGGAMQVWSTLMQTLKPKPLDLTTPRHVESVTIDPKRGKRVAKTCAHAVLTPFVKGTAPRGRVACIAKKSRKQSGRWWKRRSQKSSFWTNDDVEEDDDF